MKLLRIGAVLLMSAFAIGCGDDESEAPADNGTVNEQVAQSVATTAHSSAQTAISNGDGMSAAFSMMSVGVSAQGMITPSGGQQPQGGVGQVQQKLGEGTCDCGMNSCDFTDCDNGGGFTLTGSISWTDTSLDCDYTVGGSQAGTTYNYTIFCDLDFTETSLDGQLNTKGDIHIDANGQMVDTSFDVKTTFNAVTYPGPSGGSIDVSATTTANGSTYSANGTVTF